MSQSIYTREFPLVNKQVLNGADANSRPKFIFISGGVISGVGKGIMTSFIGAILKGYGYRVTPIKIDPYLNLDAGTFSPYEHGEVFVLDDGAEVDLDLGNYERMLDVCLSKNNNITTGKVFDLLIKKERAGAYLGKTVQIIPHVTDAIMDWIDKVSRIPVDETGLCPNICLVEVGGIVGDMESMSFLEAIRQFQGKLGLQNFCHIHLTLIPETVDGEKKTKPTQLSVRQMRSLGLFPDFIICRCTTDISDEIKKKISIHTDAPVSNIISMPNVSDIYQVFPKLYEQNIIRLLCNRLGLEAAGRDSVLHKWITFADKSLNSKEEVHVAIVGKYISQKDAYHSVNAAITHAAISHDTKAIIHWVESHKLVPAYKAEDPIGYDQAWNQIRTATGIVVPGGFDNRGIEGKIQACKYARENKVPILGLCLGLQMMMIEFGRNVLGLADANSTEMNPDTTNPVIIEMPEYNPEHKGGTMRLGLRKTLIKCAQSHAAKCYKTTDYVLERHRHRFEFNPKYIPRYEEKGVIFSGQDESFTRMEIVEMAENTHPFYVGVQYHPEFLSRPLSPSPLFSGFIEAAIKLQTTRNP